jgi:hypothetical protein
MLMADIMAYFFVIIGLLLTIPGLWLLCRGLWPQAFAYTTDYSRKTLLKPFFIGLPLTFVVVLLTAGVLSKVPQPVGGISTILFLSLFFIYAHAGVAALATILGERLPSPKDKDYPWNATVRGGTVLELSFLLPVIGWFVILPVSLIIGVGLTTRALIAKCNRHHNKPNPQSTQESSKESLPESVKDAPGTIEGSLSAPA